MRPQLMLSGEGRGEAGKEDGRKRAQVGVGMKTQDSGEWFREDELGG